ncbi:MAG: response regulator [candidate division Zixibacteria bacterium]|nr:response regulator [candidate division Zixibacteria bacterium]
MLNQSRVSGLQLLNIRQGRNMLEQKLSILLVEDDPQDLELIESYLRETTEFIPELHFAERLSEVEEQLSTVEISIILLDLGLPDSRGLESIRMLRREYPEIPIIVFTGLNDEEVGIESVQEGAQDYLVKGQIDTQILTRSIRYGIERARLVQEIESIRIKRRQDREVDAWQLLAGPGLSSITAQAMGLKPVSVEYPKLFADLAAEFGQLLEKAIEERIYKVEHCICEELRNISEQLGSLKAGPRDVVEIHSDSIGSLIDGVTPQIAEAVLEEGRIMLVQLMGYLASYYRNYYITGGQPEIPNTMEAHRRNATEVERQT